MSRADSDEAYIIALCDDVLGVKGLPQHRFDFLRGDPDKRGVCHKLPVDAYYPDFELVIEYQERQHSEAVPFFDRKIVAGGLTRGEQRRRYDKRRLEILPRNGIDLIVFTCAEFRLRSGKRLLRTSNDRAVIWERLAGYLRT